MDKFAIKRARHLPGKDIDSLKKSTPTQPKKTSISSTKRCTRSSTRAIEGYFPTTSTTTNFDAPLKRHYDDDGCVSQQSQAKKSNLSSQPSKRSAQDVQSKKLTSAKISDFLIKQITEKNLKTRGRLCTENLDKDQNPETSLQVPEETLHSLKQVVTNKDLTQKKEKIEETDATVGCQNTKSKMVKTFPCDENKARISLKNIQGLVAKIQKMKEENNVATSMPVNDNVNSKPKIDETIETNSEVREFMCELSSEHMQAPMGLVLPKQYQIILKQFESLETVVRFLFNRKEIAVFSKVQQSVQMVTRKPFTRQCLAKIRYVFPKAYDFKIRKAILYEKGRNIKEDYHLIISPNLEQKVFGDEKKMTSTVTSLRIRQFRFNLIALMKSHHKKFLETKYSGLKIDGNTKLMKWHSQFEIEKVADIPVADLPIPPTQMQSSARNMYKAAEKRIEEKTEKLMENLNDKDASEATKMNDSTKSARLKGLPPSLVAKILQKEKVNSLRRMVCNDEDDKKLRELTNLPAIAMSLRSLFSCQKKFSLPMDFVSKKLMESSQKVTTIMSMDHHLELLAATSSNWISIVPLRDTKYIKLDKNRVLRDVKTQLETAISNAKKISDGVKL